MEIIGDVAKKHVDFSISNCYINTAKSFVESVLCVVFSFLG